MYRTKPCKFALAAAFSVLPGLAMAQAACEPDRLSEKYPSLVGQTVVIGVDPQTPPYAMRDANDLEKFVGIDVDLARAAFDCAGVAYEFSAGAWPGLMPALVAGQIDVFWNNLYYTADRAKQADYVIYMQAGTGALAAAGNPTGAAGIDGLCGLRVAVGLGAVEAAAVATESETCVAGGKPAIEVFTFPDLAAGMRLIDDGRADILMWDLGFVDTTAAQNPDKYSRAFSILTGFEIGVAVQNDAADLTRVIADGLAVLQADGGQERIFQSYNVDPKLGLPFAVKTE